MTEQDPINAPIAAARPYFSQEDIAAVLPSIRGVLESGRLILGDHTAAFERAFAEYVGVEHAVAVSSCSAALQIALRFLEVRGREVILPTNNFPGVVTALTYEGGIPVLAEMDAASFCMDVDDALGRVTERTAGMVVLHLAGRVQPGLDRLRQFCADKGLFLLEDAAHAHGAAFGGRRAGSLADAGCFSFYPTKIMTTSTGGMITTNNAALTDYARLVRHHGLGKERSLYVEAASDWCMSEIHAILGQRQLSQLDAVVAHRNQIVGWYKEALDGVEWVSIPASAKDLRHAYYKLVTVLDEAIDRDRFRQVLQHEFHIETGTIYDPPCHLQPVFRSTPWYGRGAFPVAEAMLARQFCPPVHGGVTQSDVRRVADAMRAAVGRCRGGVRAARDRS